MIDTIKFKPRNLRFRSEMEGSAEWQLERRSRTGIQSPTGRIYGESQTLTWVHRPTQLRIYGDAVGVRNVEGSLARILHGTNARLIESQFEIDAAWKKLEALVAQRTVGDKLEGSFSRVDLCRHFDCDPADFIRAYQTFRYPNIDFAPTLHRGESLSWTGSQLKCRMYDKGKEQTGKTSNILRVEFELHRDKLARKFNGNLSPVTKLDFLLCMEVYLGLLSKFSPRRLPKAGSIIHFLAIGEAEGWQSDGISALEIYTRELCSERSRRLRKEVSRAAVQFQEVDFAKLLPPE